MKISLDEVTRLLEASLVRHEVDRVGLGDSWELRFDNDLWLLAQELSSTEELAFNQFLAAAETPVLDGVDPDRVATSAVVVSLMRHPVIRIALAETGELTLWFEGGRNLTARTDVETVDWQWSVGLSRQGPYSALR